MKKKFKYKVLVTTSGIGQRLGEITRFTNKSLVRLGDKPAIAYIIESYPDNTEFVVTTGSYRSHVKDFLTLAYPNKKITFVDIDKFKGPGSSLGYSLLQAKSKLNCPFIFHAGDTLVLEMVIPPPTFNWNGGSRNTDSSQYRSFNIMDSKVDKIFDKGYLNPDFLHIGLVGIYEYKKFWKTLEDAYKQNPLDQTLSDVNVINKMIQNNSKFEVVNFPIWKDVGNVDSLAKTRESFPSKFHILDKLEESIFFYSKFNIKFFYDKDVVAKRLSRAKILKGMVPNITGYRDNFYRYTHVDGELFSEVANQKTFPKLLKWAVNNLWLETDEVSQSKFQKVCYDFYFHKTINRVNSFLNTHLIEDRTNIINYEKVPSFSEIMSKIDFKWLCNSTQTMFHGDFILDNIILTKKGFSLIDWRQDFGGLQKSGDMYYDLAKLNHNLVVNHSIVNRELFEINIDNNVITCDILRKEKLVECQKILFEFISNKGYDSKKVRLLTGLIWLNMSPLHQHPFGLFLFFYGKLQIWNTINETK